jgi:hypothetical protein
MPHDFFHRGREYNGAMDAVRAAAERHERGKSEPAPLLYVASSWRNPLHEGVAQALHVEGFDIYNYREAGAEGLGFSWSQIDPNWADWSLNDYLVALHHPIAKAAFESDRTALTSCDALVLVMPSGRSAHVEFGVAVGMGKPCFVLLQPEKPRNWDLMYRFEGVRLCTSLAQLIGEIHCHFEEPK